MNEKFAYAIFPDKITNVCILGQIHITSFFLENIMASQVELHLICNAHLDPYWQWEWEEGAASAVSTFRAAADCCEQSGKLIFCHNEALLYQWIEEYEPSLFARIQKLVKEGRWHIMGGWHLQPDCNMPCAESFIRQIRIGRDWFRDKFGIDPTTAINFDSFGHTRGLVQILKKSGYDSDIVCRPNSTACPLPSTLFTWVGYDDSTVSVMRTPEGYNSPLGGAVEAINKRAEQNVQDKVPLSLRLWGVGNHGGGPSRQDTKELDAYIAGETVNGMTKPENVTIKHSTPETFFAAVKKSGMDLPRVERDLNSFAAGCYTSQIRLKQKNRQLENELWATEKMLAAACMAGRLSWPAEDLAAVMRDLATAQFHDILPGSSIQSVEDAGIRLFDHGLEILSRLKARAFFALSAGQPAPVEGEIPVLLYNPHPWPVEGVWECEFMLADQNWKDEFTIAEVCQGDTVFPTQMEKEQSTLALDWRKRVVFRATLAPSSMNRFDCRMTILPERPTPQLKPENGAFCFDNGTLRVRINTLTGLLDSLQVDGKEKIKAGACRLLVMRDNEDPWGMQVDRFGDLEGAFSLLGREEGSRFSGLRPGNQLESVRIIEEGAVRTVIEAVFGFQNSRAVVTYKLPAKGTEIDVQVRVYWNEKDKMLKLSIPTTLEGGAWCTQVPAGVEALRQDGSEQVIGHWVMASSGDEALSITNDSIHGIDCHQGELRLSLLRSAVYCGHPIMERPIAPQDRFLTRIDQGERVFSFRIDAGKTEDLRNRAEMIAAVSGQKPMALSFFPAGIGKPLPDGISLSDPSVQMMACGKSRNKGEWMIRLYNPTAEEKTASMCIPALGINHAEVRLGCFEIKTLVCKENGGIIETDLLELGPLN